MIFNPPFFSFPFGKKYPMPYYASSKLPVEKNNNISENMSDSEFKHYNDLQKNENSNDYNSKFFNIMGITICFDDLLIILLLFFLYSEGVKDDMLFIVLLLLLLE